MSVRFSRRSSMHVQGFPDGFLGRLHDSRLVLLLRMLLCRWPCSCLHRYFRLHDLLQPVVWCGMYSVIVANAPASPLRFGLGLFLVIEGMVTGILLSSSLNKRRFSDYTCWSVISLLRLNCLQLDFRVLGTLLADLFGVLPLPSCSLAIISTRLVGPPPF